jgi:hypothetical protein
LEPSRKFLHVRKATLLMTTAKSTRVHQRTRVRESRGQHRDYRREVGTRQVIASEIENPVGKNRAKVSSALTATSMEYT